MAPRGDWWRAFNDPELDRLEPRVAAANPTLIAAEATYRQAVSLTDEARASLYPTLSATAGITRSGSGSGGSGFTTSSIGSTSGFTTGGGERDTTTYTLQGSAAWEPDLWGRVRRQVASARATAEADAADIVNTRLSLQTTLANDLLQLRVSDALIRLLNDTVTNYTRSLRITQNQYAAGVAARSDVITAQTQLEGAEASAVAAGVSRAQFAHAIATLTGVAPADLPVAATTTVPLPPAIPVTIPSVLLQRRPDIAAAERTMRTENELIGVQVAAFYPTVDLSALGGFEGGPIGMLLSAADRVWSLGAQASETIFQGGARTAAVAAARAAYDQSVANYRQTVLTALQQVEDQLSGLRILARQAAVEDAAVADAQRAVTIALNEYRAGTQAYTTVVTAQNTLLSDQQTALSIREQRLVAAVTLIGALGGGWDTTQIPRIPVLNPLF